MTVNGGSTRTAISQYIVRVVISMPLRRTGKRPGIATMVAGVLAGTMTLRLGIVVVAAMLASGLLHGVKTCSVKCKQVDLNCCI